MAEQRKRTSDKPVSAPAAERDTTPIMMSPSKVAAIAKAEATQLVDKQVGGFTTFLREQSVIGIGIGLVLGTQIKQVVDTIMSGFVDPITKLFLPGKEALSDKTLTIGVDGRSAVIGWGSIAYSIFTFIIVALIVYAGYRLLKLDKLTKKKD
jgi:large-conductance mechanosensitive channel